MTDAPLMVIPATTLANLIDWTSWGPQWVFWGLTCGPACWALRTVLMTETEPFFDDPLASHVSLVGRVLLGLVAVLAVGVALAGGLLIAEGRLTGAGAFVALLMSGIQMLLVPTALATRLRQRAQEQSRQQALEALWMAVQPPRGV